MNLNKDIEYDILNRLDDKSLSRLCRTDKRYRSIYNDDNFWKIRILSIFNDKTEEILESKPEGETYKEFYKSNNFHQIHSWCLDLLQVPKSSQMVIDDFYNPETGFINKGYTRDIEGMKYLLLKLVLERYNKDGLDGSKIIELIKQVKNQIPEYRDEFSDSLNLTEKEKQYFYNLIDLPLGKGEILRNVARRNPDFIRKLTNAPEIFKLIAFIHNGFKDGKLPLDVKWDELCTHPYLYTNKLVF